MLEHQNTKPELITKDDIFWFQALFKACFAREDPWGQHLEEPRYEAFHIEKRAFIFIYIVDDCVDLLTIGTHPDQRKKGFATTLLTWVIDKAPNGQRIFLDVECQNIAAIQLYKKVGFEIVSIRKGYYLQSSGVALDAFVMTYQKPLS